jgi:hypothetical protein
MDPIEGTLTPETCGCLDVWTPDGQDHFCEASPGDVVTVAGHRLRVGSTVVLRAADPTQKYACTVVAVLEGSDDLPTPDGGNVMTPYHGPPGRSPDSAFQWKGVDASGRFRCACGARCTWAGMFAYAVRCPKCRAVWSIDSYVGVTAA